MPKTTKDVKVSLKPRPKPKAKRSTKNINKDKAPELKAKTSKAEKQSKVEKVPNAPKKPFSAYRMYCADMRDENEKAKARWVIGNKIYHERGAPSTKSLPEDADEEDTGDFDFDFYLTGSRTA
ncbi:hypothetical protein MVEG_04419 [Podila verticillata NRRL 6337]|nr:hypothetical protein MVEG_04419 [Podila verticillata NRRL 6337]